MQSSDNSTDSSDGSVPGYMDGPNLESEKNLPSVVCDLTRPSYTSNVSDYMYAL